MALNPQSVHARLDHAARRWRFSQAARYLMAGGALVSAQLLLSLALDTWIHFGTAARWSTFVLISGSALGAVLMAWRAWAPTVTRASMARRLEIAAGDRSNSLITAVQFDESLPMDSPMRTAIFEELKDPFPSIDWEQVFQWKQLRKLGVWVGTIALLMLSLAFAMPSNFINSTLRIFLPSSNIPPLTRTRIESLIPGNETISQGRDLQVSVNLAGEIPKSAWIRFRDVGGGWQRVLMDHEVGAPVFTYLWREIRQPLEYEIEAGDVETGRFRIQVRPRTAIRQAEAEVTPPAYLNQPPDKIEVGAAIQGIPAGSRVNLRLRFNNPLVELRAVADKDEVLRSTMVQPAEWNVEFDAKTVRALRLSFKDEAGVQEQLSIPVEIRADDPPKVTVLEPVEGSEVFAEKGARMQIKFVVADNHGLASVGVYQSTAEKDDGRLLQEFGAAAGQRSFEGTANVTVVPEGEDARVTYRVIARDANDLPNAAPTLSRPIVVSLRTAEKMAEAKKEAAATVEGLLEKLIGLQSKNLDETRVLIVKKGTVKAEALLERQNEVTKVASQLFSLTTGSSVDLHENLEKLLAKEMREVVLVLRDATASEGETQVKALLRASALEAAILARFKAAPDQAQNDSKRLEVEKVISGLEELFKRQREIYKQTKEQGSEKFSVLSQQQDELADRVQGVRKGLLTDSKNNALGDEDFRKRMEKAADMIGELKIYEGMLASVEHLQEKRIDPSIKIQQQVLAGLNKIIAMLNEWQKSKAEEQREEMREKISDLNEKLKNLTEIERDIVQKTEEMARKAEIRADDVAEMDELKKTKDLVKEAIEQMTTDLQAFPDTKAGNEMKDLLMQVFEDTEQEDLEDVLAGNKKPSEIAVQKEQGMLDALEKAQELAADMEHWLGKKSDATKWLMENFDKSEMPEIPMLPLADAFEDLVGDLLEEQKNIQEDSKDAASNQAFAQYPPGWDIMDGNQPSFGAQGKTGNQKPNHNEQMGRSNGGREGMSNGEMAGTETQMAKGDTPDVRRTNDAMQQGQVRDNGEVGQTRATGGGKAGGYSDRNGMEGEAQLRGVQAQKAPSDAAAVAQAMLAEKTAQKVAEAKMLFIKSDGLKDVAKLMAESAQALKEGRNKDAEGLHQRVVRQLQELKGGVSSSEIVTHNVGSSTTAEQSKLRGGNEGEAPAAYKGMVADYFRVLGKDQP